MLFIILASFAVLTDYLILLAGQLKPPLKTPVCAAQHNVTKVKFCQHICIETYNSLNVCILELTCIYFISLSVPVYHLKSQSKLGHKRYELRKARVCIICDLFDILVHLTSGINRLQENTQVMMVKTTKMRKLIYVPYILAN